MDPRCFDHPAGDGFIRTFTGKWVNFLQPTPEMVCIEDIAHALSLICRYGAHVPSHYSVAEHSLHVSAQAHRLYGEPDLTLAALMHDAAETYLGDMVRPLKRLDDMASYRDHEAYWNNLLCETFGLSSDREIWGMVTDLDSEILGWEMAMIRDAPWRTPTPPAVVEAAFLARFSQLTR